GGLKQEPRTKRAGLCEAFEDGDVVAGVGQEGRRRLASDAAADDAYLHEALEPAVHHQALARHVVAVRAAEQIDRARRLAALAARPAARPAGAARNHLVHGGDAAALHADLALAALPLDLARLALAERPGEACLDVAEGHGVDRDVEAAELLGQRLGQADDARL